MPSPTTERSVVDVPDAAVEALARARYQERYQLHGDVHGSFEKRRKHYMANARADLEQVAAALPSLEESFKERAQEALLRSLLSDDGVFAPPNGAEEAEQT